MSYLPNDAFYEQQYENRCQWCEGESGEHTCPNCGDTHTDKRSYTQDTEFSCWCNACLEMEQMGMEYGI